MHFSIRREPEPQPTTAPRRLASSHRYRMSPLRLRESTRHAALVEAMRATRTATCLVVVDVESTLSTIRWLASGNGALTRIRATRNLYGGLGVAESGAVDRMAGDLAEVAAAITPELASGQLSPSQAETLASLALDATRVNAGRFPLAWRGVPVDLEHLDALGDPIFDAPVSPDAPVEVRLLRAIPSEHLADIVDAHGWSLPTNLLAAALWLCDGEPGGGVLSIVDRREDSGQQTPAQPMRRSIR